MVSWIPHCIDQINRTDLTVGLGGIDNFIEAGKKLRGEPHGLPQGLRVLERVGAPDRGIDEHCADDRSRRATPRFIQAHAKMRATLEDWIPKILSAQEPDGYLQTAFTLSRLAARRQGHRHQRRSATGTRRTAATTKATWRATFWSRPSTTTR